MGVLDDLRYFGPGLGVRRGSSLLLAKVRKRAAKKSLASELRGPDDPALPSRLGLPPDPVRRVADLRKAFSTLVQPGSPDESPEQAADKVLGGEQRLFGRDLEVGWPPKWDWRWDSTPNAEVFADDVRSTWELQRLQGILPLARAAHTLGESRGETFADAYIEALLDFHQAHPGPDGVAWESALEVGLRLVALTQGLSLVANSGALESHELAVLRILDRHARWLRADLSLDKVVRGNHLLGELAGLLAVGCLLPGARGRWWKGLEVGELLQSEILEQFHSDGVSVEQSLTYEMFILEFLVVAGHATAALGEPFSELARHRLLESACHLEGVTAPDGSLPRVGDSDSGRGALWGDSDPERPGKLIERVREVFGPVLSDGTAAPDGPAESGEIASPSGKPATVRLSRFPQGGHLAMRTPEDDFLFVRGGPFGWGPRGPASHSHADLLAPVLHVGGEPVLIDPGVYGYNVGEDLRNAYRSWEGHNTLYFEESQGPTPAGTFRWRDLGPPATLDQEEVEEGVKIEGRVRWGQGSKALLWHRSIRYNELDKTWLIRDRTSGDIRGPVWWAFHFAPDIEVEDQGDRDRFRVTLPSGRTLFLEFEPRGDIELTGGWVAPLYGERVEAPVLRRRLDDLSHRSDIRLLPGDAAGEAQEKL